MAPVLVEGGWSSISWRWPLLALAIFSLLIPLFGTTLDHHYAERLRNHAHIYFETPVVDHVHPYEERHVHYGPVGGSSSGYMEPDAIVYLPSQHVMGLEIAAPVSPSPSAKVIFPYSGDGPFNFMFAQSDNLLQGAFIAPPDKPPRS